MAKKSINVSTIFVASVFLALGLVALFAKEKAAKPPNKNIVEENIQMKANSSIAIETVHGFIVCLDSNENEDSIRIANGTKAIASVFAPVNGKAKILRYIQDGESELSIYDSDGDGLPNRMLKRKNGVIVEAFNVEIKLIEIPRNEPDKP